MKQSNPLAIVAGFHSVETFGAVDGRGLRYVLFLSGCTLQCRFCHNPDTWNQSDQLIAVQDVLKDYNRYRPFYDAAGGGITVSGGEPLLQADFVAALFQACQAEHIHTTVDTAGYYPCSELEKVLPYTDAVLFSLKGISTQVHFQLTGKDNQGILANLRRLSGKVPVTLRYVVIPGITNTLEELDGLASLVLSLPVPPSVELLPYHTMARAKWEQLGRSDPMPDTPPASADDVARVKEYLRMKQIDIWG